MTIASGSRHSMAYILESIFGTTPTSPTLKYLRHNSTSLDLSKELLESAELRSDRQLADQRHGNQAPAGDVAFDLSYGSFDDFLEALLGGTWATDSPIAGTDRVESGLVRRYFTIERKYADIGKFLRYRGSAINSLSLSVAPSSIITGSFGIISKGMDVGSAALSGSSYPASTTTSPFDSFTGTINENGSAIAVVSALSLNIENGIKPLFVVGDDESIEPSIGRINVSGSLTAYFENDTLLNKFVNETESNLDFSLVDLDGNTYKFTLPRIKYNTGNAPVTDENEVSLTMDFQALLDSTAGTNIQIERTDV